VILTFVITLVLSGDPNICYKQLFIKQCKIGFLSEKAFTMAKEPHPATITQISKQLIAKRPHDHKMSGANVQFQQTRIFYALRSPVVAEHIPLPHSCTETVDM